MQEVISICEGDAAQGRHHSWLRNAEYTTAFWFEIRTANIPAARWCSWFRETRRASRRCLLKCYKKSLREGRRCVHTGGDVAAGLSESAAAQGQAALAEGMTQRMPYDGEGELLAIFNGGCLPCKGEDVSDVAALLHVGKCRIAVQVPAEEAKMIVQAIVNACAPRMEGER
jgi:hypothetical protein